MATARRAKRRNQHSPLQWTKGKVHPYKLEGAVSRAIKVGEDPKELK
jgi:hypothetical protein